MANKSNDNHGKITSHMKAVIEDTEELLKATAGQAGDKIQSLRAKVEETLNVAKDKFVEFEHEAVKKVQEGAKVADKYVHDNPWPSIGIATGIGLLFGLILKRK